MLPCIPSTWDAGWLEWTGEHHKWAEDRIKQSTSRCYPNFACKSHCAAPLKSLFGGSIVKRCRSLKRDPKRLWCMNLCFKPVKLNPLNPNQTFIRHLKGAVYLLGDAFVAAGKFWYKPVQQGISSQAHLTTRTATTINCGREAGLHSLSCWQEFSKAIQWLPKNGSVSKLQSNKTQWVFCKGCLCLFKSHLWLRL